MIWLVAIGFYLALSDTQNAPSAHGVGLHALLEPLLFVLVALGVWLFTRFQSRRATSDDQDFPPADE